MAPDQIHLLTTKVSHCPVGTQRQMSHQMKLQMMIQLIQTTIRTKIQMIQMIQRTKIQMKIQMGQMMAMLQKRQEEASHCERAEERERRGRREAEGREAEGRGKEEMEAALVSRQDRRVNQEEKEGE